MGGERGEDGAGRKAHAERKAIMGKTSFALGEGQFWLGMPWRISIGIKF